MSTVPVPVGTTTWRCWSSTIVTEPAATTPGLSVVTWPLDVYGGLLLPGGWPGGTNRTDRCPAAPEKFAPVTVMVLPAGPLEVERAVTLGLRSTASKSLVGMESSPTVYGPDTASGVRSFMFQVIGFPVVGSMMGLLFVS